MTFVWQQYINGYLYYNETISFLCLSTVFIRYIYPVYFRKSQYMYIHIDHGVVLIMSTKKRHIANCIYKFTLTHIVCVLEPDIFKSDESNKHIKSNMNLNVCKYWNDIVSLWKRDLSTCILLSLLLWLRLHMHIHAQILTTSFQPPTLIILLPLPWLHLDSAYSPPPSRR